MPLTIDSQINLLVSKVFQYRQDGLRQIASCVDKIIAHNLLGSRATYFAYAASCFATADRT